MRGGHTNYCISAGTVKAEGAHAPPDFGRIEGTALQGRFSDLNPSLQYITI